jgi:hypothetical protein
MFVLVMRTTASVGSRIFGSWTFSTRTSRFPCHVNAFTPSSFSSPALRTGARAAPVRDAAAGRHDVLVHL